MEGSYYLLCCIQHSSEPSLLDTNTKAFNSLFLTKILGFEEVKTQPLRHRRIVTKDESESPGPGHATRLGLGLMDAR